MAGRRPAEWRFPSEKQQKAEATARRLRAQAPSPTDEECWWASVLADPRAATTRPSPSRRLGEIQSDQLRISCSRCPKASRSSAATRSIDMAPARHGARSVGGCSTTPAKFVPAGTKRTDAGLTSVGGDDGCRRKLQRPLPDGALQIAARGVMNDGAEPVV